MAFYKLGLVSSQNLSECFVPSAGILPLPPTIFYCQKSRSVGLCPEKEEADPLLTKMIEAPNLEPSYGNGFQVEEKMDYPYLQKLKSPRPNPFHEEVWRTQEEEVPLFLPVGGHQAHLGLYHRDPTKITKATKREELDFYTHLAPKLSSLLDDHYRSSWKPSIYSWEIHLEKGGREEAFIVLENIAPVALPRKVGQDLDYFWHPNVLDIKLGRRLYGDRSKPRTIVRKKRLAITTTSHQFGMRLTGAQMWDNCKEKYEKIPKEYGHYVHKEDLNRKFNYLFPISNIDTGSCHEETQLRNSSGGLPKEMMKIILESLIHQTKKLLKNVSKFKWRSYNTSLLIVYEGDSERMRTADIGSPKQKISDVRLIDFAHTSEADTTDAGINLGLQSVVNLLENLYLQLLNE